MFLFTRMILALALGPHAWAGVGGSSIGGPSEPYTSCRFSLSRHPQRNEIVAGLMSPVTGEHFVAREDAPVTPLMSTMLNVSTLPAGARAVITAVESGRLIRAYQLKVSAPGVDLRLEFTIPPLAGEHGFHLSPARVLDGPYLREHIDTLVDGNDLIADAFWIPLESKSAIPLNLRLAWRDGVTHLELTAAVRCDKEIPGYVMERLLIDRSEECYVTLAEFERVE